MSGQGSSRSGTTLIGVHAVREALRAAPGRLRRVVVAQGRLDSRCREIMALARSEGVPVYREKLRIVERMAPGAHHQGIVAEMTPITWWNLEAMLAEVSAPALLLALDRIEDPRNFGAVVRTAESAGVHGIVVPQRGSAPPSEVAVAASAGALLHARLARITNMTSALERLKEQQIWIVGLSPKATTPWFEFDFTVPVALVLGSEGRGLRRRVAGACDELVSIPQAGGVESLNVSVAAGVVLYEAVRQRMAGKIPCQ